MLVGSASNSITLSPTNPQKSIKKYGPILVVPTRQLCDNHPSDNTYTSIAMRLVGWLVGCSDVGTHIHTHSTNTPAYVLTYGPLCGEP